jgi:hypothetical protein
MLKNTTPLAHGIQRRRKTTSVVALNLPHLARRTTVPIPTPTLAGRVTNHRMGSRIPSRVPLFVPRVYAIEAYVASVWLDVQRCDERVAHACFSAAFLSR